MRKFSGCEYWNLKNIEQTRFLWKRNVFENPSGLSVLPIQLPQFPYRLSLPTTKLRGLDFGKVLGVYVPRCIAGPSTHYKELYEDQSILIKQAWSIKDLLRSFKNRGNIISFWEKAAWNLSGQDRLPDDLARLACFRKQTLNDFFWVFPFAVYGFSLLDLRFTSCRFSCHVMIFKIRNIITHSSQMF